MRFSSKENIKQTAESKAARTEAAHRTSSWIKGVGEKHFNTVDVERRLRGIVGGTRAGMLWPVL